MVYIQWLLVYGHLFRFQFYCIVSIYYIYTWCKCIIYRFEWYRNSIWICITLAIGHLMAHTNLPFWAKAGNLFGHTTIHNDRTVEFTWAQCIILVQVKTCVSHFFQLVWHQSMRLCIVCMGQTIVRHGRTLTRSIKLFKTDCVFGTKIVLLR